jgi:hypothetical protein
MRAAAFTRGSVVVFALCLALASESILSYEGSLCLLCVEPRERECGRFVRCCLTAECARGSVCRTVNSFVGAVGAVQMRLVLVDVSGRRRSVERFG